MGICGRNGKMARNSLNMLDMEMILGILLKKKLKNEPPYSQRMIVCGDGLCSWRREDLSESERISRDQCQVCFSGSHLQSYLWNLFRPRFCCFGLALKIHLFNT